MFTYSQWLVDFLAKAAGHKYIKRVPYMSGGKKRYRYIYNVTHTAGGKHVLDPDHMTMGAAFMLSATKGSEVHAHITEVDGDTVTYRLDDGPRKGELVTESKSKLANRLNEEHGVHAALAGAREKQAKVVADLKAGGASDKHVAREQARLDRLQVAAPVPKSEEPAQTKPAQTKPAQTKPKGKAPKRTWTTGELEDMRAKVFTREPLSQLSDNELTAVAQFSKRKAAEFMDDAREYLAQRESLRVAERRRERAPSDVEYEHWQNRIDDLQDRIDNNYDGSRAYDGFNEYVESERLARDELKRRKAASAT